MEESGPSCSRHGTFGNVETAAVLFPAEDCVMSKMHVAYIGRSNACLMAIGRRGKMSARKMVRANPLSDLRVFMHFSSAPPVFVCCQGSPLVSYGSGAPEVDFCQWRRGHGLRRGKRFGGNGFRVLGFSSCRGGSECMCMCLCMYMGVVWMMDGDVISVTACQAIANIVKTSLGPVGLDKV